MPADTVARKIYRNTIIAETEYREPFPLTIPIPSKRSARSFVPAVERGYSVTEVLNNIFIVLGDTPLVGRVRPHFGHLILDGNAYLRIADSPQEALIWVWDSAGNAIPPFTGWNDFQQSNSNALVKLYYEPGWEAAGWSNDIDAVPTLGEALKEIGLDHALEPIGQPPSVIGGVSLPGEWPGDVGGTYRGAIAPK